MQSKKAQNLKLEALMIYANSDPMKVILDLCGGTGAWSEPYRKAGYDVRLITLPNFDVTDVDFHDDWFVFNCKSDERNQMKFQYKDIYGILAAPPCTEFSIAKITTPRNLEAGMETVNACLDIIHKCINRGSLKFYAIENPIGVLGKIIGKHKFSFQPYEFGDGWTKRTMLWGNFNPPVKKYKRFEDCPKVEGLYIRPNRNTPSIAFNHLSHKRLIKSFDKFKATDDASFRAITPQGFAQAFYEANK